MSLGDGRTGGGGVDEGDEGVEDEGEETEDMMKGIKERVEEEEGKRSPEQRYRKSIGHVRSK